MVNIHSGLLLSSQAVGAVVVDPASGTVLAAGHDRRYLHPLQHATMVTVDLVAKAQGGGAWQLQGEPVVQLSSLN